ncbi:MAG: Lrp/AsnC family transcriptional regulator [Desulfobacterales bacterium]
MRKIELTELEKKVVASLQGTLPITKRPYLEISEKIGVEEETFLSTLKSLCDRGIIRRFGATIRHQKSGFLANAMGAWQVEEDRIDEAGRIMASFKEVTHCYRRNPADGWPYNLYTMIHGASEEECYRIAQKMANKAKVKTYTLLFSRKELKKTSMKYFNKDGDGYSAHLPK